MKYTIVENEKGERCWSADAGDGSKPVVYPPDVSLQFRPDRWTDDAGVLQGLHLGTAIELRHGAEPPVTDRMRSLAKRMSAAVATATSEVEAAAAIKAFEAEMNRLKAEETGTPVLAGDPNDAIGVGASSPVAGEVRRKT